MHSNGKNLGKPTTFNCRIPCHFDCGTENQWLHVMRKMINSRGKAILETGYVVRSEKNDYITYFNLNLLVSAYRVAGYEELLEWQGILQLRPTFLCVLFGFSWGKDGTQSTEHPLGCL